MNLKYYSLNYLIAILFLTILSNISIFAQATDTIPWSKKYGTVKTDAFHSIIENNLGEVVAVGTVTSSKKDKNILFARINPTNGLLLENSKELGGPTDDYAYRVIQTIGNNYIIIGGVETSSGNMQNAFIMQVDGMGKEIWKEIYKPTTSAVFYDVLQNSKGDLYVTGQVGKKACLLKYTAVGNLVGEQIFDTFEEAEGLAIKLTVEEDIIIAMYQKKGKHHTTRLQKIRNDSFSLWQYDFPDIKVTDLLIETDKIAATGTLYSTKKQKKKDLFLLTLTLEGQQTNRYDYVKDRGEDGGKALVKSKEGYYYTAGYNTSFKTNINLPKLWVSKIDKAGKEVYPDYYLAGGKSSDKGNDIIKLRDGRLIIAGQSASSSISHTIAGVSQSTTPSLKEGAWLMSLLPEGYIQSPVINPTVSPPIPKPSIRITWLNKLKETEKEVYKAYQPVNMELRAIIENYSEEIKFTIALNDSEHVALTSSKEKSDPTKIRRKKSINHEIDFDPIQLSLKEGLNTISIKGDGVVLKEKFSIEYIPSMPNLHLVSIGIPYDELDYTSKDAKEFANLFASSKNIDSLFEKIKIDTLINAATTKEGVIKKKMLELKGKEVKYNDYILIFISAHGLIYENEFFIPASNYEAEDIGAINFNRDIIKRLKDLDCKKLIFIDACNSGKGVKGPVISNNAEAIIKITEAANGFYIMTSSSAKQKSYENVAWENGAFTEALIEAFTNKKVDIGNGILEQANKNDAYLTLAELFEFTKQRVAFLVQGKKTKQTPTINKELSELHVPIFQSPQDGLPIYQER